MRALKSECKEVTNDSKIKFEENKRKIIFDNDQHKQFIKVQVDGCQITEGLRCDNMLIDVSNGNEYFVELKGIDVGHALDQLSRTLALLSDTTNKNKSVASYIISTNSSPALRTNIQAYTKLFKRKYNSSLIIKERMYTVKL